MNVSQETINVLYELIGQCFRNNRILDRLVSVLGVEFAMSNTASLLHQHYAHQYPMISDIIGEKCLEAYNISVIYEATPVGNQNYESVKEMITVVNDMSYDFQNMLIHAMMVASNNEDMQVYVELGEVLKDFNPMVAQSQLLLDKVELYGDALYNYDADINKFFSLG